MSTTNQKIIDTRIVNRHDTLSNWNGSNLELMEGEIALAYVEAATQDDKGNIIYVPTYLMKVGAKDASGNLQKFEDLPFLHAPASDVHAWAKNEEFDYNDAPTLLALVQHYNKCLAGIGNTDNSEPADVKTAIVNAINALDFTTTGEHGQIPVTISQTDGTIAVTYAKLTNDNIADNAAIAMIKVQNLDQMHKDIYGVANGDPGIKSKVENLVKELGEQGKIMEFIGVSSTDPTTAGVTINGEVVNDFEAGDTVVFADTGKEFIYYDSKWQEIGYASDVESSLSTFAGKVLNNGLNSDRSETLEAEVNRRATALERTVNGYTEGETIDPGLVGRTETIENTLSNYVPQSNATDNFLRINEQVVIFNCGTSEVRDGIDSAATTA